VEEFSQKEPAKLMDLARNKTPTRKKNPLSIITINHQSSMITG
jgi:hypothetical protein